MLAHYVKYEQVATGWEPRDRPISRSQIELVASRTSSERLLLLNDFARDGAPCEQQEGRR